MILLEIDVALPKIKTFRNTLNHRTILLHFGFFKITWLNKNLTNLFLKVLGLSIHDMLEIASRESLIEGLKEHYETIIEGLESTNEELLLDNAHLKESIQNLSHDLSKTIKKPKKPKKVPSYD